MEEDFSFPSIFLFLFYPTFYSHFSHLSLLRSIIQDAFLCSNILIITSLISCYHCCVTFIIHFILFFLLFSSYFTISFSVHFLIFIPQLSSIPLYFLRYRLSLLCIFPFIHFVFLYSTNFVISFIIYSSMYIFLYLHTSVIMSCVFSYLFSLLSHLFTRPFFPVFSLGPFYHLFIMFPYLRAAFIVISVIQFPAFTTSLLLFYIFCSFLTPSIFPHTSFYRLQLLVFT